MHKFWELGGIQIESRWGGVYVPFLAIALNFTYCLKCRDTRSKSLKEQEKNNHMPKVKFN